jgi:hypothetical protein
VDNNTTPPVTTPVFGPHDSYYEFISQEAYLLYMADDRWNEIWTDNSPEEYPEPPIRKIPDNEFIPKWAAWAKNSKTKVKK